VVLVGTGNGSHRSLLGLGLLRLEVNQSQGIALIYLADLTSHLHQLTETADFHSHV
jgi:hypothetical protein